ncbi:MAG: hypothetical protein DRJ11_11010 [Candidatus Aminicenantes bacterium]|nr:MAG: hypothetical protein DRJ11_11010 [Candidatus Aminicenantes bacterium]
MTHLQEKTFYLTHPSLLLPSPLFGDHLPFRIKFLSLLIIINFRSNKSRLGPQATSEELTFQLAEFARPI